MNSTGLLTTGATEVGVTETGGSEGDPPETDVPTECSELVTRVLTVFAANCSKCHGAGSVASGGIDYILDLDALIANAKVVPGNPEGSRVYVRMSADMMPMPPLTEAQRPTAGDIQSVHDWIEGCAVESCIDQPFITRDEMLQRAFADLGSVPLVKQKFTRYFSFVHLWNAGWCDADIETARQALAKLVNSLSQETLVKAPVAIDFERLVFRVDISHYDWDRDDGEDPPSLSEPSFYFPGDPAGKVFADRWEMIADQNPYTIEYIGDTARALKSYAGTHFPILQGDAFIDAASRSPLYYDILGIPLRAGQFKPEDALCAGNECLETQLKLDILAGIEDEKLDDDGKVDRAGLHQSGVSDYNRVIERHRFTDANNRMFWISYDFTSQRGLQNIGDHPLDFTYDATEILFNLPNGLQAYMLADASGDRINEGMLNIVQDESQKDFLVRNGVSCMGCHLAGMIKRQDDIRYELDAGQTMYDMLDEAAIRALYPEREVLDELLDQDIRRFNDALTYAGVTPDTDEEPVITTFLQFDEDVDLRRAAAELTLRADELGKDIGKLGPDLDELSKDGGRIRRKDFTDNFADSACIEGIGCTRACSAIPNGDPMDEYDVSCGF